MQRGVIGRSARGRQLGRLLLDRRASPSLRWRSENGRLLLIGPRGNCAVSSGCRGARGSWMRGMRGSRASSQSKHSTQVLRHADIADAWRARPRGARDERARRGRERRTICNCIVLEWDDWNGCMQQRGGRGSQALKASGSSSVAGRRASGGRRRVELRGRGSSSTERLLSGRRLPHRSCRRIGSGSGISRSFGNGWLAGWN